ncbi:MAG: PRC-barrel domain-containing protein [Beijerinckiaceae bacterium]
MGTASPTFNLISSNDVEGTTVYDPSGTKIGEIDHLMIDKLSGNVRYAVMSFGGFLGLGHGHYPLPWNALDYDSAREGYVANVTENQLKDAPEFSDDSWMDRDWEARWHRHFEAKPYWEQGAAAQSGDPMNMPRSM